MLSVRDTAITT